MAAYYMLEIREPTNCPGDVVTAYIFTSEEEAKKKLAEVFPEEDGWEADDPNEWEDYYTNGKVLKVIACEDAESCGRLIRLDNN